LPARQRRANDSSPLAPASARRFGPQTLALGPSMRNRAPESPDVGRRLTRCRQSSNSANGPTASCRYISETIYVVCLPYLPLVERMTVGDWEAIPQSGLREDDCRDARTMQLALGLADLYGLPEQAPSPVGAFGRPRRGHVDDDPEDRQRLHDLQRAVVVAVLDANESPLLPDHERDPNFGHYAMTSDNATGVAHGIKREGGYTGR
jgi:hypothetical protein